MPGLALYTGYVKLLLASDPSRREVFILIAGTVLAIASGVPFPLMGIVFGDILNQFNAASCTAVDTSYEQSYQTSIESKIKLLVYLAVAQFVLIYSYLLCWSLNGARLAQRLREQYLRMLIRQEPSYFDRLPPGEVAARLDGDIQAIRSGTSDKVGICIAVLSFFITAYVVAFIKDAILAAMLLALIPAYLLMSFVGSHYIEKYSGIMSDAAANAASIVSEALSNIMVVQAFGANKRLEVKFAEALDLSEREGIKKALAIGIQTGMLYFIAYAANALAFWQGSRQIANAVGQENPSITVGAVFTVIFILVEASLLLSQVAPFIHLFGAAVASHSKLRADIERVPLIDGAVDAPGCRLERLLGAFELRGVTFAYPSRPEVTVLDDFSLKLPAGKHTAIVGLSGSGKSTIAGLLTRLYDPVKGQVTVDDRDLKEVNTYSLRSHIGLVQQEPSLLDRSILENIASGLANSPEHPDLRQACLDGTLATLAQCVHAGADLLSSAAEAGSNLSAVVQLVIEAARVAQAHDFISSLPKGYATMVGSTGRLISGGQRQRIALARAIVKQPGVLILDEATSALDSTNEELVQKALERAAQGRTMITIAHRLSTIRGADNIVVMHKGKLVEQGSHAELMLLGLTYAEMVRTQSMQPLREKPTEGIAKQLEKQEEPLDGKSSISIDEKAPISVAVLPATDERPEEDLKPPKKSVWSIIKGYSPALRPHLLIIFVSLLASVIVGASFSGEAVVFGNTVGSLSPCNTADSIRSSGNFFGLMFFLIAVIELFANIVSWTGFGWVSEKLVYTARTLCYRALFEHDMTWHQSEGRTPGNLLSHTTRDGSALAGLSGSVLSTIFSITINLLAAIIMTHIIAWKIALVCLALVPLLLGSGLMELHTLGKFEEKHATAYASSVEIGVEAAQTIKTIASFSLEEATLETYRRALAGPRKEAFNLTVQASLFRALTYFIANCVNALAYWWGSKQIISGTYTQVEFLIVSFALLVGALLWAQMFALAPELSNARAAMARILGLIETGSEKMHGRVVSASSKAAEDHAAMEEKVESKSSPVQDGLGSTVELKEVHFAYPARPDLKILDGLSLRIESGKFCALVGPSGAGKSTVIAMVEKLYDPQSGSILIDGLDVTQRKEVAFRADIALVPQDSVLFEGTVEFNVGLGARPGRHVTLDEIQQACKLANVHEVIQALPEGYQTRCGPLGNQFSGGQKQRLAIARALVRKPRLLILDEPTSALDAESERLLEAGLETATRGITVIAIAHRLRTIRKADVICLIERGRCVDSGTHEELFARSQSYRANVMHQIVAE